MKKIVLLLLVQALLGALLRPAFAQSPWAPYGDLYLGAGVVWGFYTPQPNVLWVHAASYGRKSSVSDFVSRTVDDGKTWERAEMTSHDLYEGDGLADLTVLDGQNAWLVKYDFKNGNTVVARTTSGPSGFKALTTALPARFRKIHFFTADLGIAFAVPAADATSWPLYRTTDGGTSWKAVENAPLLTAAQAGSFMDKQHIATSLWLVTSTHILLHTPDAGLTWTTSPVVGKLVFEDALHGLSYQTTAAGEQQLSRTTDGGLTWAAVAFSGSPIFNSITAVPGLSGTYVSVGFKQTTSNGEGSGVAAISRDQGMSWQQLIADDNRLNLVKAFDATHLWASNRAAFSNPTIKEQASVVRYSPSVLAAKSQSGGATRLAVYPNPTTGLLRVEGALQGEEDVRVYDSAGRLCQRGKVSGARPTLDLTAQPAGLYQLVFITASGQVRSQRLSKIQ